MGWILHLLYYYVFFAGFVLGGLGGMVAIILGQLPVGDAFFIVTYTTVTLVTLIIIRAFALLN